MKRIIFEGHPDGVPTICGAHEGELPVCIGPFVVRGHTVPFASLVKVTERMAFYREPLVPSSAKQHFHASPGPDTTAPNFDPRQV